jgi:hypothetical protein
MVVTVVINNSRTSFILRASQFACCTALTDRRWVFDNYSDLYGA